MTQTRYETVTLTELTLSCCGITVAYPEAWVDERLQDHATWYCPNGHSRQFVGKSEAEELRDKLETEKQESRFWRERKDEWEARAETNERRRRATKAVLTKTKKRIAEGKCPCCRLSFSDLHAHMSDAHPDYAPTEP